VSHAIEKTAVRAGFSVVRDFVGHASAGKCTRTADSNFGPPGGGSKLKKGIPGL
jgi:methionine aminopeptidase